MTATVIAPTIVATSRDLSLGCQLLSVTDGGPQESPHNTGSSTRRFRNVDGELLAQGAEGRFQLIEPGSITEIKQSVHLRHVPVQPACEFRLAYAGGPHLRCRGSAWLL